jgi:very-short-patch-repair endonuclease
LAPAARALRRNATSAERRLWQVLRRKQVGGFRFRRQVILGGFVADFACLEARLVLEVDGATHGTDDQVTRDLMRTDALGAQGFAVLRFTNDDVYRNLDDVAETIARKLAELRPRVEDSAC